MYHVFVKLKNSNVDHLLLFDLSRPALRLRFLNPYLDGKDIYINGSITRIADISNVTVLQSELTVEETLRKMNTDHQAKIEHIKRERGLSVHHSFRGRNVTELIGYCKDVTSEFIDRAPGSGTQKTKFVKFIHNPWVVRLVAGGFLALLSIVFGKVWGN